MTNEMGNKRQIIKNWIHTNDIDIHHRNCHILPAMPKRSRRKNHLRKRNTIKTINMQ